MGSFEVVVSFDVHYDDSWYWCLASFVGIPTQWMEDIDAFLVHAQLLQAAVRRGHQECLQFRAGLSCWCCEQGA